MSKLNEYAIELDEQAGEMGFESLQQALQAGCEVEYGKDTVELLDPLEAAHRAWEKEKADVLEGLSHLLNIYKEVKPDEDIIKKAIKIIKESRF